MILGIVAISCAISVDASFTGLAYGVAGIGMPASSRFIISFVTAAVLAISMSLGDVLSRVLPTNFNNYLAIVLLIIIGIYLIFQGKKKTGKKEKQMGTIWQLNLPALGLIIQILRHPVDVDQNADRSIAAGEALLLSLALSIDSFGVGIGLAMGGFPFGPTVLGALLTNFILLTLALKLGRFLAVRGEGIIGKVENLVPYIPPMVILAIATIKIVALVGGML